LAKIIQQKKSSSWYSLINEDFDNTFWEADQKVSTRKLSWKERFQDFDTDKFKKEDKKVVQEELSLNIDF
jgi:hypothetical protein